MKIATFLRSSVISILGLTSMAIAAPGTPGSIQDPSSSSNVDAFAPSHLEMDYFVDFETSTTFGTITHQLTVLQANTTTVFLDVWDAVEVRKAEFWTASTSPSVPVGSEKQQQAAATPSEVSFDTSTPNPNTGKAIGIVVPEMPRGTVFHLRLTYKSLPETTALSWVAAEQTAGKAKPFLYSLCQMNFCRDWAPMMDTPSQKITYNASVTAPNGFLVIMSGNKTGEMTYNDTWTTTTFECALRIPSYQIALIVGELEVVDLGGRVVVMAERPYVVAAAKEFEDLPRLLAESEAYLTPYIWGDYAIVVMPPNYPWGGMEHVNANQVSHTLLAGDKSMLSTAIHEITHSWFGNDVGCKNWNHFWINEGMNVFMERKILGSYYGEEFAKIQYFNGNSTLYFDAFLDYGLNNSYSSLFPDIGSDDPENSFSDVPYEKGSQFMLYVETLLGLDGMRDMLRDFIGFFSQQAIDQREFKTWYKEWVEAKFPENATTIVDLTMWDTWVLEPGPGPVVVDVVTTALQDAEALAVAYLELNGTSSPPQFTDYESYYADQKVAFINKLSQSNGVTSTLLETVDNDLRMTTDTNPMAKTEWYRLGIKVGYGEVLEPTHKWLGEQGRSAYCNPLFRSLVEHGHCDVAREWFAEYESFYNSYVVGHVKRALEPCNNEENLAVEGGANPEEFGDDHNETLVGNEVISKEPGADDGSGDEVLEEGDKTSPENESEEEKSSNAFRMDVWSFCFTLFQLSVCLPYSRKMSFLQ